MGIKKKKKDVIGNREQGELYISKRCKKLEFRGKIYESEEKLAKAVNKDPRTIRRWISKGNVEVIENDACN